MFSEKDVSDWAEYLDNIDLPVDYEISLVCFVTSAIAVMLPWPVAYFLIYIFTTIALPQKEWWNFVMIKYIPEL